MPRRYRKNHAALWGASTGLILLAALLACGLIYLAQPDQTPSAAAPTALPATLASLTAGEASTDAPAAQVSAEQSQTDAPAESPAEQLQTDSSAAQVPAGQPQPASSAESPTEQSATTASADTPAEQPQTTAPAESPAGESATIAPAESPAGQPSIAVLTDVPSEQPQTAAPAPTPAIPQLHTLVIDADRLGASVELKNPAQNAGRYNLEFSLRLKRSGETLFRTGIVGPDRACRWVQLSRTMQAGEYAAVLSVQPSAIRAGAAIEPSESEILLIVR